MNSGNMAATTIQERGQQTPTRAAKDEDLSTRRLIVMRVGYAFMGLGWPSSSGRFCSMPHPSR